MDTVFLLRRYRIEGYGLKRIDCEFIFDSLKHALQQLDYLKIDEIGINTNDFNFYRFEILEIKQNSNSPKNIKRDWHYNLAGLPLGNNTSLDLNKKEVRHFDEYFAIGNFIVPQVSSHWDFSNYDIFPIGVISENVDKGDLKQIPKSCLDRPLFAVDFINDLGYLERDHFNKYELLTQFQLFNQEIPEMYSFLKILSDHYVGERILNKKELEKIYNGEVYVKHVPSYFKI